MSDKYREEYWHAMVKEHKQLTQKGVWSLLEQSKVPPGAQSIPSIWVLKDKRFPNGQYYKFKARINARGDL